VSETAIQQWYGPMAQPSEAEVAAAIVEYEAEQIEPWAALRLTRNAALAASDWTQVNDTALTSEEVDAWKLYRSVLRDLPENTQDPSSVTWPSSPDGEF
jgi:hypothetical protein